ncbi:glycerate kinase, partial [Bacillaceae bacterium SIJ1]|uniref:glycerate kinase n=1 Tax=Litoribacterium kuwaitense TaxID=1398745 RepID=UPI0013EAEFCC
MKIIVATDSFKGSATSFEVASYIEKGIKNVKPEANIIKFPLADGGEGTVEALTHAKKGYFVEKWVTSPNGEPVLAKFGVFEGNKAVIEMAEASGLTLLKNNERNPFKTTTYGTGELIKAALDVGVEQIFIGIGGSATNDGGVGMAQALGASFQDKQRVEVGFGAEALDKIHTIDVSNIDSRLKDTNIVVFSDVTNPLCGT